MYFSAGAFILAYSFVFGLIAGSFLNVCIYRIPKKLSIVWPGSSCTQCGTKIKWYDNIPLLSWLLLRGKCRGCGAKISFQYPAVELFTAVITVLFVHKYGLGLWAPCALFAVYCLIILSVIDMRLMIIPDRFSIGLIVYGLAVCFINPAFEGAAVARFLSSFGGACAGFFGMWAVALIGTFVFKKEAMGGGDVKLMGAIGALSGVIGVVNALIISSFAGIFYFGILVLLGKPLDNGTSIPFGPFLSVGLLFNLYFPAVIFSVL
ncbi:MAG: prepilin peptidase [Elusimicrobiota bacterium]|jgi:leader peptidase (prepilin peptidase)/N-methyltransferase|nr:prepilin peptidase [Elusimicrobiota bacterium]